MNLVSAACCASRNSLYFSSMDPGWVASSLTLTVLMPGMNDACQKARASL
ncbi:MAG: hypothetical protein K6A65_00075 [Succinivibrionaceae bacterium]|nr:hypothetical protein [Succinivibrionaceae bacterium]